MYETHFEQRWRQRGMPDFVDASLLKKAIEAEWRIMREKGHSDTLDRVGKANQTTDPAEFYRFRIGNESFYVLIYDNGTAGTVYTQAYFRRYRKGRKHKKKMRSSKERRPMVNVG